MNMRFYFGFLIATCLLGTTPATGQSPDAKVLVMVVDGLRPDYVRQDIMPTLNSLRASGVVGVRHHAVFPTVTRVNSSSIATGAYPQTHGLMGNSMYVPALNDSSALSTGEQANLLTMEEVFDGALLTVPTLAEYLATHNRVLFAASSGSSGSGYLLNHKLGDGGLVHYEYVLPAALAPVVQEEIGMAPESNERPAIPRVRWAIDAILEVGLDRLDADVLFLWVTEPDGTAHTTGIGSPATLDALRKVDREICRLIDEIAARNLGDRLNLIVTADHGFSTDTGTQSIRNLLIDNGLKAGPFSKDVVLAGGAIHVNDDRSTKMPAIIALLQQTEWIGPIFTVDGRGGTLTFDTIFWNHDRSADILTGYNWNDDPNTFGYPGSVTGPGVAGHGSTSPFDIQTFFLMHGPAFKQGIVSRVPSGNVDLAPTALDILQLQVPAHMDGRILREALRDGPDPALITVETEWLKAGRDISGHRYLVQLKRSWVDGHAYVDETRVQR